MAGGGINTPQQFPRLLNQIELQVQMNAELVKMFPVKNIDQISFEGDIETELIGNYPTELDEDTGETAMVNFGYSGKVAWAQVRFMQTDKDKLHGRDAKSFDRHVFQAANTHGILENNHILGALKTGAHANNTVTAANTWVDSHVPNSSADILANIAEAVSKLVTNSEMSMSSFKDHARIHMFLPTDAYAAVVTTLNVNNSNILAEDYLMKAHNLVLHPSKDFTSSRAVTNYNLTTALGNDALLFMEQKGMMDNVARLFHYDPAEALRRGIPLVETQRVFGKGDKYLSRRAYVLKVINSTTGGTTNFNIGKISTIRS